jgi:hypothetical protein
MGTPDDFDRFLEAVKSLGVGYEVREYKERDAVILTGGTELVGGYPTSFAEFKFHKGGEFDKAGVYSTKPQGPTRPRRTLAAPPPIKGA